MHIVILGNGFAGVSALETIQRHDRGTQVTVISREDCGFYSPASLFAYLEGRVEKPNLFLRAKDDYARLGVSAIFGRKVLQLEAAQKAVYLDDGTKVSYDRLLIATGASSLTLDIKGVTHRGVFKLDTLADAEGIMAHGGRQVVIVGAGRIGVELASVLQQKGAQVTLVEMMPTILPGVFHPEIAHIALEQLLAHGVQVRLGEKIVEICGDPVEGVKTERGDIPCDTVIMAVGRRPNVDFVDSHQVSLGEAGGILVDEHLRSTEDVYAAGDCAETFDFLGRRAINAVIPTAIETGRIAALNMLGFPTPYPGSINANVLIVFGRAFFSVGSLEGEKVQRSVRDRVYLYILQEGRLVGAQFVGEVTEAAQVLSAIRRGIRIEGAFRFDALRRQLFLPSVFPNPNR